MSIFVDAKTLGILRTQEKEDTQRQASAISRQIGDNTVAKPFAVEAFPAAEEHQQTKNIDRQPPCELHQIEKCPAPACRSDWHMGMMFCLIYISYILL